MATLPTKLLLTVLCLGLGSGCRKKSADDESADLAGETTPIVVSGGQPVSGESLQTVISTNAAGQATVQVVSSTNPSMIIPSSADAILPTAVTTNSISISWPAATNALTYESYVSISDNITTLETVVANGTKLITNSSSRTATAGSLLPDMDYYLNVLAIDGLGRKAAYKRILIHTSTDGNVSASAITSIVSVVGGGTTVASGSAVTLRLQAKTAAGGTITNGGSTVLFMVLSGSSTFNEPFPVAATDVGNGTYTATLTGKLAGSATVISALIDGVSSVSSVSVTVLPGPVSMSTSTVAMAGGQTLVNSGSSATLEFSARDAAGNPVTSLGSGVTFTRTGGSASFSQSFPVSATHSGNGIYGATLTGVLAGTAPVLKAVVNAVASVSSTTLSVGVGPISPLTSTLSIVGSVSSIASGSGATVKLTAKDAAGNLLPAGGSAISFTKAGGTSSFNQTFALSATDAGDGTYSAALTGNLAGTAAVLGANIGATPVTSTVGLSVTPGSASTSTSLVSIVGGASGVGSGGSVVVNLQAKDAVGNNLTTGGLTVTFTRTGGSSTFIQSFPVATSYIGGGAYTATVTGDVAGSAATIGATIGGAAVTSTTSLSVTTGSASTSQSLVSVVGGATSVNSANSVTVKLQSKDASGNNLTGGGLSITFTQTGGTSTFVQSFPVAATDNGDGTYTAILTGSTSGSVTTLGAKIDAASVVSSANMTVNPGAISAATSLVSIVGGASNVVSGSNQTLRLTAKDAAGNLITAGGSTVAFNVSGGTSTFSQSFPLAATDNIDGTYTAAVTGNIAGTAATFGATIGASAVTSTTSLSVTPGTISLATSVVGIAGAVSSIGSGSTATLRLQAKDAAGNNLTVGGSGISFTQTGGASTFSETFPLTAGYVSNGLYTAVVTGVVAGSASTIGGKIGASSVTSTTSLGVTPGAISAANSLVTAGSATVPVGVNVQVTLTAYDAANNPIVAGGESITFTQSGGTSTFTQSFPLAATNIGDGTYKATLTGNVAGSATTVGAKIGATTVSSSTNISVDSSVGAVIGGEPTGTINTTVLNVTISGTSVVSYKYKVGLTASTDCTNSTGYSGSIGVGTLITNNISGQADGPTTLCVVGADGIPNWQPYSAATSASWTKKATPPSFTSLALINEAIGGYINAAEKLVASEMGGSLVGSAYSSVGYKLAVLATTCDGALTYGAMPLNTSSDFSADGAYKICVKLSDTAGNPPAYGNSPTINLKATAPGFTSLALVNEAADLYISAADKVIGNAVAGSLVATAFDTAGYKLAASGTTCNNSLTYGSIPLNTSLDFGADGNYKVCVKLSDNAGNPDSFGSTSVFALKSAAPAFTSLALANEAADSFINAAEKVLANALGGAVSGSGYDSAGYKLVASATTCNAALTYGAMPLNTSLDFGADGSYKICVSLSDNAGNAAAYGASANITLKTALPAFTSLATANNATDGFINAAEKVLANALAGSLVATGYDIAAYKLTTSATTCNLSLAYGTLPLNTSADFGTDGSYKVCVKLTDNAGNTPAYGASGSIVLKTTTPAFTSLSLLNDAADGYINAAEKLLTNALSGSLSGTAYDTAAYKLVSSATTCDGGLTYGASPASNSADFGSNGTYKVCARLSDNAGNTPAYGSSSTFTLDTSVPSLVLTSAAPNPTNTSPISVTATFSETVTGFTSGKISAGNGTVGSVSGSGAVYSFNVTPSAQGTVTVNVAANGGVDAAGNQSTAAAQLSRLFDSVGPVVTNVTSPEPNATYGAGQAIVITVNFDGNVEVTGTPVLSLNTTPARSATYTGGTGTSSLSFLYTTVTGDVSADLDYSSTSALSGTIKDAALNGATLTLAAPGTANSLGGSKNIVIDTVAATVVSVTSTLADGSYKTGTVIPIFLNFSESVDIAGGVPSLTLNTSPSRSATYVSGTATSAIRFNYTVVAGDTSGLLDYLNSTSLQLNGATIQDSGLTNAVLSLPTTGGGSSLVSSKLITVDTTSPVVTGVTSLAPNATYSVGASVDLQVSFSEPVNVTGFPRIQLNVGGTRYATYSSGSGSGTLQFNYTVASPDCTGTCPGPAGVLGYVTASALTLNGGSISDDANNVGTLTLAAPGTAGSLSANKSIVIDYTAATDIGVSGVTCCATNSLKANSVELTISLPPDTSSYNNIKVRRIAGSTAPSATDCTNGTAVATLTNFTLNPIVLVDNTLKAGQAFSYRICAFDGVNTPLVTRVTSGPISSSNLHWVFMRSTTFASGNIGGISAANTACQTAGNTIDSTLSWVALLSDASTEAAGRIPIGGAVYNRETSPAAIATNFNGFWSGTLSAPVKFDETGAQPTGSVWTGTDSSGYRSANTCTNWTSNSASFTGLKGTAGLVTTSIWSDAGTSTCNTSGQRIYCMSKTIEPLTQFSVANPGTGTAGDVAVTVTFPADTLNWSKLDIRRALGPVPPSCGAGVLAKTYSTFGSETFIDPTGTPGAYYSYTACVYKGATLVARSTTAVPVRAYRTVVARTIFVTSSSAYKGDQTNIAGVDALCSTAGKLLDAGKTWLAVVSATSNAASARHNATSNIRNVRGDLVATSATDMFDGSLGNPIEFTELGDSAGAANVWTGATSSGGISTDTCTNWSNATGGRKAEFGIANATGSTWIIGTANAKCNLSKRFYCMSTVAD